MHRFRWKTARGWGSRQLGAAERGRGSVGICVPTWMPLCREQSLFQRRPYIRGCGRDWHARAFWHELAESFRILNSGRCRGWLDIIGARENPVSASCGCWRHRSCMSLVWGVLPRDAGGWEGRRFLRPCSVGCDDIRTLMSSVTGTPMCHGLFVHHGWARTPDRLHIGIAGQVVLDLCMYCRWSWSRWFCLARIDYRLLLALPALALIYVNALWIAAVFSLAGASSLISVHCSTRSSIFLFLLTPISGIRR